MASVVPARQRKGQISPDRAIRSGGLMIAVWRPVPVRAADRHRPSPLRRLRLSTGRHKVSPERRELAMKLFRQSAGQGDLLLQSSNGRRSYVDVEPRPIDPPAECRGNCRQPRGYRRRSLSYPELASADPSGAANSCCRVQAPFGTAHEDIGRTRPGGWPLTA